MSASDRYTTAERVRAACIDAAIAAHEDAARAGLCGEGALEAAVGAMRALDLAAVIDAPHAPESNETPRD